VASCSKVNRSQDAVSYPRGTTLSGLKCCVCDKYVGRRVSDVPFGSCINNAAAVMTSGSSSRYIPKALSAILWSST
jgi:hypothetical protein